MMLNRRQEKEEEEEEEGIYASMEGILNNEGKNALSSSRQRMAREALDATGGKSTIKATQWLLGRRSDSHAGDSNEGNSREGVVSMLKRGQSLPWSSGGGGLLERLNASPLREAMSKSRQLRQHRPSIPEKLEHANSFTDVDALRELSKITTIGAENQMWSMRGSSLTPCLQGRRRVVGEFHDDVIGVGGVDISSSVQDKGEMMKETLQHDEAIDIGQVDMSSSLLQGRGKGPNKDWQNVVNSGWVSIDIAPKPKSRSTFPVKTIAPLSERMRPNSISEIVGQDHLFGACCILRSLLNGERLPCIIFIGPHGTGKTSLARLVAHSALCRFVILSQADLSSFQIQEILSEAKEAMKCGQRTVLFVEKLSAFSTCHQEKLLCGIEEGHIVFIGATTTMHPSKELILSLWNQSKVFTLRELQYEDVCGVLERAILDMERGVRVSLGDVPGVEVLAIKDEVIQFLAKASHGNARVALDALEASICIALRNWKEIQRFESTNRKRSGSRVGTEGVSKEERTKNSSLISGQHNDPSYNVLEHLEEYFQVNQGECSKPFKKMVQDKVMDDAYGDNQSQLKSNCSVNEEGACIQSTTMVPDYLVRKSGPGSAHHFKSSVGLNIQGTVMVTLVDAKEAFQCEQAEDGKEKRCKENNDDFISAMLKAMRGGQTDAAIHLFARAFMEVEDPLRRIMVALIKFASEEIGMADPQALVQAVSCHRACELMGVGKDCFVYLMQCVLYLSMAPKSNALPRAFQSAQRAIQSQYKTPHAAPIPF